MYSETGIPGNLFVNLTALKEFRVEGGIIGPLVSESLAGLVSLWSLTIHADFLDDDLPPGLFLGHRLLQLIDIRSTSITRLAADTFSGLDQLTTLDLSENFLTTLPNGLFRTLTALTSLNLGSNKWHCTCDMAWLAVWSVYTGMYAYYGILNIVLDFDCWCREFKCRLRILFYSKKNKIRMSFNKLHVMTSTNLNVKYFQGLLVLQLSPHVYVLQL